MKSQPLEIFRTQWDKPLSDLIKVGPALAGVLAQVTPRGPFQPRLVCDFLSLISLLSHWVWTALKTSKNVITDPKKIWFAMDIPPQEISLKQLIYLNIGDLAIIVR